jgi:1-acyl-sn-glycerol-3-phosphate acyltransferase
MAGLVTTAIRLILRILCRVDADELERLPGTGPYLIVVNHVNFLEVPMLYTFIAPRVAPARLYSLIKVETWKNPFLRFLAGIWYAIPIERGTSDFSAFRAANRALEARNVLILAPEGTRSGDGVLRGGHPGAIVLALHNRIPVYPVVHVGGHLLYHNLLRLRRTPFRFRVGEPFRVDLPRGTRLRASLRRQITDETMGRIAALLPREQRGRYLEEAEREPAYLVPVSSVSAPAGPAGH